MKYSGVEEVRGLEGQKVRRPEWQVVRVSTDEMDLPTSERSER